MAPYCITMLLTLDYGETAKGKPEAPKAQTPYYCTGQSRASSSENSTQRVQDSPSVNKKTPALRAPDSKLQGEKGGAHRPTRPQGLRVTEAFRLVSPYIKDFEAKPTDKKPNPDPDRHSPRSGGGNPDPDPDLSGSLASSVQYLAACKAPDPEIRISRSGNPDRDFPIGISGNSVHCQNSEKVCFLFNLLFIDLKCRSGFPDRQIRISGS